jgi:RHS repeat-associated protein
MSNRYTGQVLDEETGLYYYNARYYDPELGRFTDYFLRDNVMISRRPPVRY